MAQNFDIAGTTYNGVDSISMTNENGEKITYVEKVNAGTGVPVATIGSREFYTVEDALKEAVSGETVVMIADSNEPVSLIIPSGVTLNLQSNTLTVNSIIGMDGSFLTANVAATTGKLIVPTKDSAMLAEGCVTNSSGFGILPIWITNHYEFSLFNIQTTTSSQGLYIDEVEEKIEFVFAHQQSGSYKAELSNGGADNGIKVVAEIRWQTEDGLGTPTMMFPYSDTTFKGIAAGGKNYTFTMTVFSAVGVNLDTMEILGKVVTDTGAVFESRIFTKADDKLA